MVNIGSLNIGHSFRPTHNILPIKIQQVATVSPIRILTVLAFSTSNSSGSTNIVPQIKYLTKWKIVGNSGLYPVGDLKGWSIEGNSEVRNNQIYSCGDLEADGKYHIKVKSGSLVIDIPLDEPLRKVNAVVDTIELLKDGYDVDLSNPLNGYYMLADGGWDKNSADYGYEIPVFKGCKVIIVANSVRTTSYGFLRNNTHNKADTIGVRNLINSGEVAEITIDSDECKYLWIGCAISTGDSRPQSVVILSDTTPNTAKVTRNIGSVDLGSLSWTFASNYNWFSVKYANIKSYTLNMMITQYNVCTTTEALHNDMSVAVGATNLVISDYSCDSNITNFKEKNKDSILLYELAEPTTSYISVPNIPSNKTNTYLPSEMQVNWSKFTYNAENGVWSCGDYNSETGKYDIKIKCGEETVIISLEEPLRKVKDTYDRIEYTGGNTAKLVRKLANANNNFSQATILNDEIKIPLTPNGTGLIDGFGTVANVLFHTKVNRMSGFGQYVYLDKGNYTDIEQWKKDNINQNLIYATMDYTVSEIPVLKIPESNSYIQEITESSLPWTSFTYNENMVEENDDDWSDDFD